MTDIVFFVDLPPHHDIYGEKYILVWCCVNLKNMKIKTKALILFITFIIFSLAITVFFVIKTAEVHFASQVEKMLIAQADALSDKLRSFETVSSELKKYNASSVKTLLDNEISSMIDTAERVSTAYALTGEREDAISFRIMDIMDKKTVGKSGFAFAMDYDGMMAVPPHKRFAKDAKKTLEDIAAKKGGMEDIPFARRGYASVDCKNYERFSLIICAALPDSETSASSAFVTKYAQESFEEFIKKEKVGKTGYYYLVDTRGNVLVHPDKKLAGKNLNKYPFMQTILKNRNGSLTYRWDGHEKLAGYAYIKPLDAILVGGAPINEFIGKIKRDIIGTPVIVGVIVIIIATILMNVLFNRTIVRPIKKMGLFIEKISSGDLTSQCRLVYQDEIGVIGRYMNSMTDNISGTLKNVRESAHNVKTHSDSLSNSGVQLSDAIKAQSERTGSVERSIQEILASFDEVSGNMQEVNREIRHIRSSATDGQTVLENTVTGIRNLSETVIGTSGTINSLGDSSKQILEIVGVISDIADQTNLLALNAAIEAARAGEHGRGFAVVADEVRKLAERTVQATTEINQMTSGISRDVNRSVKDMQEGARMAKEGEELASELQQSLEGIINGVMEAAEKIDSVSAAINQQNDSSRKISEDSSKIAEFSKNNAEIAAGNRKQAEMLNDLASNLIETVDRFKLKS